MLGPSVLGSPHAFDMEVRVGAGAYVCGEETSLLESLEGRRGTVRAKPPLPAHKGLFARPTVINNVLSLASVPIILAEGAEFYKGFGMGRSRGTMPIQLAGNIRFGGLFETAFGVTLGELVEEIGGGTLPGRPVRAVQVGGPLGAYFPRALFDTPFDYEAFAAKDGLIGHGGVVVFDDTVDMKRQARFAMEFCAIESCGKCTPCRIGATRGVETIDKIIAGQDVARNISIVEDLCQTMKFGSLCALGGFTPYPVLSAIRHFPEDFDVTTACSALARPSRTGTAPYVPRPRNRLRHAPPRSRRDVTLTIDGVVLTVPRGHLDHAGGHGDGDADPQALRHRHARQPSAPAGSASIEIEGRPGTPASCTTPVAEGLVVGRRRSASRTIRKGVMELYISDHPLDCLTCAANGDCELQDMAGAVGLREVRYGYDGENHLGQARIPPTPISPSTPRNASSARAAFGPARRCRAPSR